MILREVSIAGPEDQVVVLLSASSWRLDPLGRLVSLKIQDQTGLSPYVLIKGQVTGGIKRESV